MTFADLLASLREFDLLLDTDQKFPSVTGLFTGGGERGCWWVHPQAPEMFRLSCALRDHPDVLLMKLISGKVTFVHRPLWPAIFAIGAAREAWQMDGLSKEARALLKKVDKETMLEATGDAVRELETRLLVHAASFHTVKGSHAKHVESWKSWARKAGLSEMRLTPAEARAQLEQVVARLNQQFHAVGTLPWQTRRRGKRPTG